jgi:formylmethanofuran dehydrogenase subunit E-like metal-binding protein
MSEIEQIDQSECYCKDCPNFDELNLSCWAFHGRFGEAVSPEDVVCDYGFNRYFNPETKEVW